MSDEIDPMNLWQRFKRWLSQTRIVCGHGYTWIETDGSKSGCYFCGKEWR